ncbi:unnamed protein product [Diabrotica balteata]|uniref:Uncharacterized protein n=1 Tax=Diabrotica balteata TaxID=107213 RepID=A0A9N9SZZ3_DIABA|nr:unnamed protein product [Diabrotica balteata]
MKDIALAALSVVASFILVILFVLFGWFIVWKLILSRFRFIKELLKGASDSTITELKNTRSKLKRTRKD